MLNSNMSYQTLALATVLAVVGAAGCESDRCSIMCEKVKGCGLPQTAEAKAFVDSLCNLNTSHEVCEGWALKHDPTTAEGRAACMMDQTLTLAINTGGYDPNYYTWYDYVEILPQ